ncbi:DUF4843 domain-containing protein [Sphingobacterium olei]|nr:DUF4843 domain-containing protein [Sphingobacterium olei]
MKTLTYLTLFSCLAFLSCEKQDVKHYDRNDKAINIWFGTANVVEDSLSYNYAFTVPGRDSVLFHYRWLGIVPTEDIHFELEATGDDKDKVNYSFGTYVIKAGQYEGTFPIYIDKPANFELFKNKSGMVTFQLKENDKYSMGAVERSHLHVSLKNAISKPVNWDTETISTYRALSRYFGAYNDAKYGFIIQTTGFYDFRVVYNVSQNPELPTNTITDTHATYLKALCKLKLQEYEAVNGPLIDETTKERVVFPL